MNLEEALLLLMGMTNPNRKEKKRKKRKEKERKGKQENSCGRFSIAFAAIKKLLEKKCRCLFSTHYHKLTDEFANVSGVGLGHMACTEEKCVFLCLIQLFMLKW